MYRTRLEKNLVSGAGKNVHCVRMGCVGYRVNARGMK